ncbi:hypothetical protein GGP65_002242 [Salinibacter ruber]|nr:hypothetical protein [Salinibacter ruber]
MPHFGGDGTDLWHDLCRISTEEESLHRHAR